MTNAPYVLPKGREGTRLGDSELIDSMIHDGLWSSFLDQHMGEGTDEVSAELGLSREEQDAWAARSHQRAHAAWESGHMAEEVVPVEVPQRRGSPVTVDRDEGIRPDTTPEKLAGLAPAFRADGTITAGNASQISDGACAVVVMSAERAQELGVTPLAEIVAYGMSSDRYPSLHTVPAMALERALKRSGLAAIGSGTGRDQRGLRGRADPFRPAARRRRRDRQRQRGSGRPRPSHRRVGREDRPDPPDGDASTRRGARRRGHLWWRRTG